MIGRNNPLNIRYNPMNRWQGQSGQTRGFCNFRNLKFGIRAVLVILRNYRKIREDTYAKIIKRWAPDVENNTLAYTKYVCDKCKVFPFDTPFESVEDLATLIYYMWCYEQGKSPSLSIADIECIINDLTFEFYDKES